MKNMSIMEKGKKQNTAVAKKVVAKSLEGQKAEMKKDEVKAATVSVLESVKAVTETPKAKESVAKVTEEKATEEKIIKMEKAVEASKKAKKETAKKTTQEAVKLTAKKTTTKNQTRKEDEMGKQEVYIQFTDKEIAMDAIIDKVKNAYVAEGNQLSDADDIRVYIKPEENMVYYVVNCSYASGISLY